MAGVRRPARVCAIMFCLCALLVEGASRENGPYTYEDPETGEIYYSPDEPGGAYTTSLPLPDYRGTAFEDLWWQASSPPVHVIDLNEDGNLDLILSLGREVFDDRSGDLTMKADLAYCEGDGTGHFHSVEILAEEIALHSFAVGDIDGDGMADIALTLNESEEEPYRLILLQRRPDGSYRKRILAEGYEFFHMSISDVTGDGNPDIVGLDLVGIDDSEPIAIQLVTAVGDGTGEFATPVATTLSEKTPFFTSAVDRTADYDGDGKGDMCFTAIIYDSDEGTSTSVLVLGYGQEDGSFRLLMDQPLGDYLPRTAGTTGDFNGDGHPDVAYLHMTELEWVRKREDHEQASGLVSVHYNDGTGRFRSERLLDFRAAGMKAIALDVNEDGFDDLISFDGHSNAAVWLGSAGGERSEVDVYTCMWHPDHRTWAPFAGDFDNDGMIDIGVDMMGSMLGVRFGNGEGGFGSGWFSPPVDSPTTRLADLEDFVADFDGDGHLDLVQVISTEVSVAFGDGTGRFPETVPVLFARQMDDWAIGAGDVNGDGADDILISSRNDRQQGLRLFWGGPDRGFTEAPPVATAEGLTWIVDITVAHVDDDDHADLLYNMEGVLQVARGDGTGAFDVYTTLGEAPALEEANSAVFGYWLFDADADGYTDIITDAFLSSYRLWLNDGTAHWSFAEEREMVSYHLDRKAWDEAPEWLRLPEILDHSYYGADLDGDGLLDFATANDSLLQIALTGRDSGMLNFSALGHSEPVRVHRPIAADVNGDGWIDLITAGLNYISVILNQLGEIAQ